MKQRFNVWLPDSDQHFEAAMAAAPRRMLGGRLVGTYQLEKLFSALGATKKRRVAVDIGAHVGFWSMWLAEYFDRVEAFEPVAEHAECFDRNMTKQNVALHRMAIGSAHGFVGMVRDHENSGMSHVSGQGDVAMIALDDMRLDKVDFIKIDVEGYEADVIAGARETISRCLPVVVFESKGHHKRYGNKKSDALDSLLSMGMRVREVLGCDYVMDWKRK